MAAPASAYAAAAATRASFDVAAGSTRATGSVALPHALRTAAQTVRTSTYLRPLPATRATLSYGLPAAAYFLSKTVAATTASFRRPSHPSARARAVSSALNGAAATAAPAPAAAAAAACEDCAASLASASTALDVLLARSSAAASRAAAAATSLHVRRHSVFPFSSGATATDVHALRPHEQQIVAPVLPSAFGSRRFSANIIQRAVRELPWGSREDLLRDRVAPVYVQPKRGTTPRREYNENLLDGVRVRPTVNPCVKLNKAKRYVLDNWPSRNWEDWTPYRCYVRGSRRRYNIPQDLFPYKDELGEWHPPRLSARYKADVKKQYIMNGLPWVWEKDFYEGKLHFADRELLGPKRWYRQAFRRERVKEALRKMDDLVLDYRREVRDRKKYDWFEKAVYGFAGEEMAIEFIRKRVEPKF